MAQLPITVTYEETPEYFIDANKHLPKPRWWMHLLVAPLVGIPVAVACYFDRRNNWKGEWVLWYAVGVGFYLLFAMRKAQGWQLKRYYKKQNKGQTVPVKWEFYEADLLMFTGVSSTRMSWTNLTQIIQFPDGFLFRIANGQRLWIPRTGLASADDFSRLSELLTSKVANFERR